jgi:two-component system chemotaxis response regulator CheV
MNEVEDISQNDIQAGVDYITKSHLRNVMQLAVFYTGRDDIYAINISKIQSFLIKEDIEILNAPTNNQYVKGLINLRGEIIYIVDFDKWLGHDSYDTNKIIIVCNYNQKKIGILVKDILKIDEKSSEELRMPSSKDEKISYITDIKLNSDQESKMCIVFDAERLLYDTNREEISANKSTIYDISNFGPIAKINSNKLVLIAEDSSIVIEKLHEFFTKLKINYEIYENGQLLLDRLETLSSDSVGMVITDIEMPIKNGYQVIKYMKEDHTYSSIPIISLTSMTNQGVKDKIIQLGAIDLVNKSDLTTLQSYIEKILNGDIK